MFKSIRKICLCTQMLFCSGSTNRAKLQMHDNASGITSRAKLYEPNWNKSPIALIMMYAFVRSDVEERIDLRWYMEHSMMPQLKYLASKTSLAVITGKSLADTRACVFVEAKRSCCVEVCHNTGWIHLPATSTIMFDPISKRYCAKRRVATQRTINCDLNTYCFKILSSW